MNFKIWLENLQNVDSRAITQIYEKAKISVDLVKQYHPELLGDISVIANLASGAYGVYTHFGVNQPYLSQGKMSRIQLNNLPKELIQKTYPDINQTQLQQGDVIRVNVNRIINDPNVLSDLDAVIQIAATIVHEATHKKEIAEKGVTSEIGPTQAEKQFIALIRQPDKLKQITDALIKFPQSSKKIKNKLF